MKGIKMSNRQFFKIENWIFVCWIFVDIFRRSKIMVEDKKWFFFSNFFFLIFFRIFFLAVLSVFSKIFKTYFSIPFLVFGLVLLFPLEDFLIRHLCSTSYLARCLVDGLSQISRCRPKLKKCERRKNWAFLFGKKIVQFLSILTFRQNFDQKIYLTKIGQWRRFLKGSKLLYEIWPPCLKRRASYHFKA